MMRHAALSRRNPDAHRDEGGLVFRQFFKNISFKLKIAALFALLLLFGGIVAFKFNLVNAQQLFQNPTNTSNPFLQANVNPDVQINQHTGVQTLFIEGLSAVICQLSGIDIITATKSYADASLPPSQCLTIDKETGKLGYINNNMGAIGMVGNLITQTYSLPVQSGDYMQYLASNFGVAEKTYAQQSQGFRSLSKLLVIWVYIRNLAYLVFIVVFVLIGLAIMLRIRIDPRTVMTIQNQIPKIIIGIILITFSYALVGFLVDLMWVTTYFGIATISRGINDIADPEHKFSPDIAVNNLLDTPFSYFNAVYTGQVGIQIPGILEFPRNIADNFGIIFRQLTNSSDFSDYFELKKLGTAVYDEGSKGIKFDPGLPCNSLTEAALCSAGLIFAAPIALPYIIGDTFLEIPSPQGLGGAILDSVLNLVFKAILGFVSWVLSAVVFIVILLALLIALFRIWFMLLKAYLMILLDTILGPLWIVGGVVPGSQITFNTWIRHVLAHLSVFPATIAIFLTARLMIQLFEGGGNTWGTDQNVIFVPPLVGNPSVPEALGSLLALMTLFMAPGMTTVMRAVFGSKPAPYTAVIGQTIGAGFSAVTGGGKAAATSQMATPMPGVAPGWKGALRSVLKF